MTAIRTLGADQLRRLSARQDRPGLAFLAFHLALLAATTALVLAAGSGGLLWAAMFLQGLVIVHLFAPFHEATHGTAFSSRWLNAAVAWASGLAIGWTPTRFRREHELHHRHTGDPARDPQMIPAGERLGGYLWYATAIPYFRGLVTTLLRDAAGRPAPLGPGDPLPAKVAGRVVLEARLYLLAYAGVAALSVVAGSTAALTLWLVPRLIAEPVMRLIRMAEHVGCRPPAGADPGWRFDTRTVVPAAPLRWLNWNMGFHAEHHAAPIVPFHALPTVHTRLRGELAHLADGYAAAQAALLRNAVGER